MKKILITLFCFQLLLSCNSGNDSIESRINDAKENRAKVGKVIDQRVNNVKPNLPITFENGVIWEDIVNEYDINQVHIYKVSSESIDIVMNYISKNQLIVDNKAANAHRQAVRHGINLVYRYYYNNEMIKEIKIEPQDFK